MPNPTRLHRRTFLGGAGAVVSLPLLEAMLPRKAQAAERAPRLVTLFFPNGTMMGRNKNFEAFLPAQEGRGYALTSQLMPLAPVRDHVTLLSNVPNYPANTGVPGGPHWTGTVNFATGAQPVSGMIGNGISVDQAAAKMNGAKTKIPSLVLTCDTRTYNLGDYQGLSKAYKYNISWTSATTPVPPMSNPLEIFNQLFKGFDPGTTATEQSRRLAENRSVLDYVMADQARLQGRVGTADRRKLDEFSTGVRELEQKLFPKNVPGMAATPNGPAPGPAPGPAACRTPVAPKDLPRYPTDAEYPMVVDQMLSLVELSFSCDLTRAVSLMLAPGQSHRTFNFLGVTGEHHELSHYATASTEVRTPDFMKIVTWYVAQFAKLTAKLRDQVGPDGRSLLDDTLVYCSSEIGDADVHEIANIPVLLAGRGGGIVNPGRYIRYKTPEARAKLFVTMLRSVGVPMDKFGVDGMGPMPLLDAAG